MSAPVQYDVIPAPPNAGYPYFVILQSDLMQNLATRVVAPLIDASKLDPLGSLWPKVTVGDTSYVVVAPLLQSIKLNPATVALANGHPGLVLYTLKNGAKAISCSLIWR